MTPALETRQLLEVTATVLFPLPIAIGLVVVPVPILVGLLELALRFVVPLTVSPFNVPTVVRDEPVTVEASVVPVSVPAAAGTTMPAVPSNVTPLMALPVCSAVAVAAFPVTL